MYPYSFVRTPGTATWTDPQSKAPPKGMLGKEKGVASTKSFELVWRTNGVNFLPEAAKGMDNEFKSTQTIARFNKGRLVGW